MRAHVLLCSQEALEIGQRLLRVNAVNDEGVSLCADLMARKGQVRGRGSSARDVRVTVRGPQVDAAKFLYQVRLAGLAA